MYTGNELLSGTLIDSPFIKQGKQKTRYRSTIHLNLFHPILSLLIGPAVMLDTTD